MRFLEILQMRNIWTLYKREFYGYFQTPIAYVFLAAFLFLSGIATFYLGNFFSRGQADLIPFFNFHPWLYMVFIPVVSMRLWSEEFKVGTVELLFTLPITIFEAVISKILAAWSFIVLALVLTGSLWIFVNYLGKPDNGVIFASYLGSILMAGAFLVVGSCVSAITKNQVIAFVVSLVVCLSINLCGFPVVLDNLPQWLPDEIVNTISMLSFLTNFEAITKGLIEIKAIFYFLTFIIFGIFINVIIIREKNKDNFFLTAINIVLIIILFITINIFSNILLKSIRFDFTAQKIYTLSQGSKKVLREIDNPITLKLYFSKKLSNNYTYFLSYSARVQELLNQYKRAGKNKILLKALEPESFTEIEDQAVNYGLQGIPVDNEGREFYFGLVGINATGQKEAIPFIHPNKEKYLEYDISQIIYNLIHVERTKIGILGDLPLQGNPMMNMPSWVIWEQLRQLYDVQILSYEDKEITQDIKVLILANPSNITENSAYAVDQYVMRGGHVLAFIDPYIESMNGVILANKNLQKLLTSWGVNISDKILVSDKRAKQVRYAKEKREYEIRYPVWMDFQKGDLALNDIITSNLERLTLASPGVISIEEYATTDIIPLVQVDKDSMLINAEDMKTYQEDPEELLRNYKDDDNAYILAARITGPVYSAFNSDLESHIRTASDSNIVLVADADMLYDGFWVNVQNFLGNRILMQTSGNGNFVLNAIDNLRGSNALISVRNQGTFVRPFDRIQLIQRKAQGKYLEKEKSLVQNLKQVKQQLTDLEQVYKENKSLSLNAEQQRQEEFFRQELLNVRKQLREVRRALNKDIEQLEVTIKFINIALLPAIILFGGLILWFYSIRIGRRHVRAFYGLRE